MPIRSPTSSRASKPFRNEGGASPVKTIAVIEDNADNRMLLQAILSDQYAIDEYEDGPTALEGVRRRRPDLILLDISLPGTDGTQVLKEVRGDANLGTLPVIALTAHAMAGDREKYLSVGFDDYVTKPIVDERFLLAAIDRLLNRKPPP